MSTHDAPQRRRAGLASGAARRARALARTSKRCPKCGLDKPLDQFARIAGRGGDGLFGYCDPCQLAYRRELHSRRRAAEKAAAAAAQAELDARLNEMIRDMRDRAREAARSRANPDKARQPTRGATTSLGTIEMWPGILGDPWPTCELCCWAVRDGVFEVKFVNRSCSHVRALAVA